MNVRQVSLLLLLFAAGSVFAQDLDLPTDPLEGRIVFEEKQCITCHAVGGYGGHVGPDFSRDQYFGSGIELASIIWNHAPAMNRKFRQLRMARPKLTEKEMLNLMGFLYYLRYLGEPGSVANGRKLIETKRCINCHSIDGVGGTLAPDFKTIPRYSAPLYMVQAMWNHGPAMSEVFQKNKMELPTLTGEDIVDIASYLKQVSSATVEARLSPGNPKRGRELFDEKGCSTCHRGEGKRKRIESGLLTINLKAGVTEVASVMWNHGRVMMEAMEEESIEWPHFDGNEMADVIAYIYFLGFEDSMGDVKRGERVFAAKGCVECHQTGGGGKGLDPSSIRKVDNPIRMIQLMWNHAGDMEDLLISQNKRWPELTKNQMRDLYAYLQNVSGGK
jgi:mono/diheme cytochrome c family protein